MHGPTLRFTAIRLHGVVLSQADTLYFYNFMTFHRLDDSLHIIYRNDDLFQYSTHNYIAILTKCHGVSVSYPLFSHVDPIVQMRRQAVNYTCQTHTEAINYL